MYFSPCDIGFSELLLAAHGTIADSLAISFASQVVKEVTRRPRQLMDEVHREIQSPARFVHSAIVYLDDTRMVEARKETSFSRHCRL